MPPVAYGLDCENLGDGGNVGWHPAERPSITLNTNGNIGVAYGLRSDAPRSGVAKTPSVDAEGRVRLRDPGFNVMVDAIPTIDGGAAHIVSTGRGTPLTLAIRGRGDSHDLEYRDDGTANAILTPNGGRAGIGVGAVATYGISSDAIDRSGEGDGSAAERAGLGIVFDGAPAIRSRPNNSVAAGMSVRRLTPRECERLQGFPDDFTAITYRGKPAADGRRYRALGNSMAVPVIGWVIGRIREVAA